MLQLAKVHKLDSVGLILLSIPIDTHQYITIHQREIFARSDEAHGMAATYEKRRDVDTQLLLAGLKRHRSFLSSIDRR
jgi:hypothetical protein